MYAIFSKLFTYKFESTKCSKRWQWKFVLRKHAMQNGRNVWPVLIEPISFYFLSNTTTALQPTHTRLWLSRVSFLIKLPHFFLIKVHQHSSFLSSLALQRSYYFLLIFFGILRWWKTHSSWNRRFTAFNQPFSLRVREIIWNDIIMEPFYFWWVRMLIIMEDLSLHKKCCKFCILRWFRQIKSENLKKFICILFFYNKD